mgnify:FL=1
MFLEVLVASGTVGEVTEAGIGLSVDIGFSLNAAVLAPGVPAVEVLASKLFTTGAEMISGARVLSSLETDSELSNYLVESAVFTEGLLLTFSRLMASDKELLSKSLSDTELVDSDSTAP